MTDKPTGVFVRLPLSDKQKLVLWDKVGDDAFDEAILAIGTPVTGGELDVVGYAHCVSGKIVTLGQYQRPDVSEKNSITSEALIYQSDALAKLAEKDAEIARLMQALDEIEMGIDALPDDNEDYSKITAQEMQRQALFIVRSEVKALKGPEA